MAFLDFLFGSKSKLQKIPTLSPEQGSLLSSLLGNISPAQFNLGQSPLFQQGQSYLQNLLSGSPEAFQQFETPLMRQFQEQIIPGLAERFGGIGAKSSSAFQQALGQAGAGLSESLAALRSGLQMQALPQALGYAQAPSELGLRLSQLGLGTPAFGYQNMPGSQGFLPSLLGTGLGALAPGFGQLGSLAFTKRFAPNLLENLTQTMSKG